MIKTCFFSLLLLPFCSIAQTRLEWQNVDSAYGELPKSVNVYFTNQPVNAAPFRAYYVIADLKDKSLDFTTDTTLNRRFTPSQFYAKNNAPLVVVNGTFFSFGTNQNLNLVVNKGNLLAYNQQTLAAKGKDTLMYWHSFASAIGISKRRKADVAWTLTDSLKKKVYAVQKALPPVKDSIAFLSIKNVHKKLSVNPIHVPGNNEWQLSEWKMKTAIGGGPVLVQDREVKVTNNEERKFAGKAINDKHPRTAMGYTKDDKLIILVIEGRSKMASGATLTQEAEILKDLGCVEALNLDGGGSSSLLINGKETIKPSDASGQRPVPGVFLIKKG
jgi:hypothetical protein